MIRKIITLILKPIAKHKPDRLSYVDWLMTALGLDSRSIHRYRAIHEVHIPGAYLLSARQPVPGIGYRHVKVGTEVMVRTNKLLPNRVDVQFHGGQGNRDLVYRLNAEQWQLVKLSLEKI